ncbi:MBL fold metallo-hydrolase [Chitinophaga nivalis]|uniref:MBL fold metallo-hydrolase n=1 Tax=Chitinophaga nivalis TaxID=2991709 RepID=A0ABT3IKC4_9BACT|nr:MBL fold metallo-hydrolase [Chitinophaga nivalis]MCW3465892.1 MBL fold metallo-hydrolase [Chitinophaga nivalis]MCW3484417.1 MBL fold metallo-hydrolase [Chitinophaga nivalis]
MKQVLRRYLYAAAITLLAGTASHTSAQTPVRQHQPGIYRMQVGDIEVIALSDGTVPLAATEALTHIKPGEVQALLKRAYTTSPVEASVNAFLIKTGGKLILIDAGSAELYGPTLGFLPNSIREAGYQPEDIDAVLLTHIHTDHSGGLMMGDKMVFPNALVYASEPEVNYWMNANNAANAPERLKKFFREADAKVGPYLKAGKVRTFTYGKALFPGITPIATPGHTPGHTFYALESKNEKMLFWGDIMHVAEVQFVKPDVTIAFDVDPAAAAQQRKKAYADAARQGYWIAAAHISFPGIGHLRAAGKSYEWVPIIYKY